MKSPTELKAMTLYVGLWGWQLIAITFLGLSLVLIALPRTTHSIVFAVSFFVIFSFCEYKSLERKKEFYEETDLP